MFRLRINLGMAGADLAAGAKDFRLQFTGGNTSTGPWSEVGVLPPLEIALDSSSSNSDTGAITTLTISHAVATNTNRVLVVGAVGEDDSASDCSITGVSYSSVALTQIDSTSVGASPTLCASLWYLLAPDVGTDSVVITYNGAVTRRSGGAISIYNAAQQAPEATAKQTLVSTTTIITSLTTITDGAWLVDVVAASNGAAFTPTETGQTEQYDLQAGTSRAAGAIRDVPASGPTSMGWSKSASDLAHIVAAFTPYSVSTTYDRVWRGYDNPGVVDGTTLPGFLIASSTVAQSYEEENPSTTTPRAMSIGDFGEWDWVIEDNGAESGDYYFRMVTEDGTTLDTYVNFPTINAAGPTLIQRDYQWYDNEDALTPTFALASTNTAVVAGTHGKAYRLRMNVELNTVDLPAQTLAFNLQYSVNSTSGPWFDIGSVGSTSTDWAGFDNPGVINGVTTTPLLLSSTVGESYEETSPSVLNPNALIVTTTVQRGEWDWVVEPAAAATVTKYYFRMVQSDGTQLSQYLRYPEITTPPAPLLRQNYYQWWENRTNITPNVQLEAVNTPHTNVDPLVTVRLRMNVELTAANMATSSESFKLQFATSTAGPWTDVGGDGSTELWRGEVISGATTIDGATLPTLLLTPTSTVAATFEEENPSAAIPNAINIGDDAEWDWVVQNNTAPASSYFFRMVYADGTPLTTYTTYPEISTSAPTYSQDEYQWFLNIDQKSPAFALASENTPYTEASSPQVLRLRMNVLISAVDLPADGEAFKLQYAVTTTGPWTDVGPTTSTGAWRGFDNPSVSDGVVISVPKLTNTDKRESYEESNPSVANLNSILTTQRGEWDWVIQNNNALSETRYYFRMVTVDGAALSSYLQYPQVSTTQS